MSVDQETTELRPLIGTEDAVVDDKGRLLFSRQKRERLGDVFAVTLCECGCLAAYPLVRWNRMWREISERGPLDPSALRYEELLYNHADDEVRFDSQNRAVISKKLRDIGKLQSGEVQIIGRGRRAELWSPKERLQYLTDKDAYEALRREELERAALQVVERWPR